LSGGILLENHLNPLLNLPYEPVLEKLGSDYYDPVYAAEFPQHRLRFCNYPLLAFLGLNPNQVSDADLIQAFGQFQGRGPFLALRYHGYQFGEYNPYLGDGRGFLYGQVRGIDGKLYDLGTKGSGTTPYSRGGDGRLTLKGGVREVLAAESLYSQGVYTSRCLSLIETGEQLWRGDEPSPTRSSVMVRFSRSHIRFGTFERLLAIGRHDLISPLLDHVIDQYYPQLQGQVDAYIAFYHQLVKRIAHLAAQWMAAGFCHGVLNTDNMSISGESFDYGPYAFIPSYNPRFTAAYFDHFGRYAYGNQPQVCRWNLEMLQRPLEVIISSGELKSSLDEFETYYLGEYSRFMLLKLGFDQLPIPIATDLLEHTLNFLFASQVSYPGFFATLSSTFNPGWRNGWDTILGELTESGVHLNTEHQFLFEQWQQIYHRALLEVPLSELPTIGERLRRHNPQTYLLRPTIETVWEAIDQNNDWEPFNLLVAAIQTKTQLQHWSV
jgi:serine/tyrosine/threonine adenylyltransferase